MGDRCCIPISIHTGSLNLQGTGSMLLWLESHLQGLQYNGVGRALDVGQRNSEIYFTKAGSLEFTPIHSIFFNSDHTTK